MFTKWQKRTKRLLTTVGNQLETFFYYYRASGSNPEIIGNRETQIGMGILETIGFLIRFPFPIFQNNQK